VFETSETGSGAGGPRLLKGLNQRVIVKRKTGKEKT